MKSSVVTLPVWACLLGLYYGTTSPASSGAVVVHIGQNFTGSQSPTDSDAVPSDTEGAAGPTYFVELINGRYSVYEKATGKRVQTETDLQFWKAAGVTFGSTLAVADPRIIFDTYSKRWFASMVDFNSASRHLSGNRLLLAVSATADPTGRWSGFAFRADPAALDFADFPTLGLDQSGVYISADMFDRSNNEIGPCLYSIPKSALLAHSPSNTGATSFGIMNLIARGAVLQPSVTIGIASTPEFLIAVSDTVTGARPLTELVESTVSNADTTNATLSASVRLTVPAYESPLDPAQPDGSNNLDVGDLRFSATVRRVHDTVYAVQTVEVNGRSAIRWYKINAPDGTLIQSGTISDPNLDLYYPSIAANDTSVVVIGCNGSSLNTFISSYAVVGDVENGTLTFGDLILLKAGTARYQSGTGTSRWGDYSATSVDPNDPNRFWTIQQVGIRNNNWATQITELITGVRLNVTLTEGNLVLSWTASSSSEYQLQASPTLSPALAWEAVAPSPSVTNGIASVVLVPTSTVGFFRLSQATAP